MPAANEVLLAMGGSLTASIVAKATVAIVVALTAAWLARTARASVRHVLLASAFGVILLLPAASFIAPPVRLSVPVAVKNQPSRPPSPAATAVEQIPFAPIAADLPHPAAISVRQPSAISLSALLLTAWITGAALFLLPLMVGLWQVRSLRQSGLPWPHGQALADTIAREVGVRRRVAVLMHEEVPGPMTCGVVHPVIVLPPDAGTWDDENLQRAILHELEHIRRSDSVTRCLARVACAVYWFHPLVWIAWRKFVLEAERSCDDAVLERSDATAYADQLVGLAKHLLVARKSRLLAMANRADLATRVGALLDAGQRRGRAGTLAPALACAIAAVLVIAMSPLRLIAAPQAVSVDPKPVPPRLIAQAALAPPPKVDRPVSPTPAPEPPKAEAPVEFEVASVKPAAPLTRQQLPRGGPGSSDPAHVRYTYLSVKNLLILAYGMPAQQITGPAWIDSDRYDIVANVPPGASGAQVNVMLRNLLADRFKLAVHRETRELPLYELTVAKNGPRIKPYVEDPNEPIQEPGKPVFDKNGVPVMRPGGFGYSIGPDGRELLGRKRSIEQLALILAGELKRPVVDKTGLTGDYDYSIKYAPDLTAAQTDGGSDSPDLLIAVQEQLGLKLESKKGPIEMLVVDGGQRTPTEN